MGRGMFKLVCEKQGQLTFLFSGSACSCCIATVGRAPCLREQDQYFTVSELRGFYPDGLRKYGLGLQMLWLFGEWAAYWTTAIEFGRKFSCTVV